ncbi:MAG: response regulator [Rhodospirillaceae bacterium]
MPSDLAASAPQSTEDVDLKRITVLVVEDEDVIRDVICALLQKIGIRHAVAVGNAEDAMYQLEDDEETKVDLVLVDLMLPGASGLSLIKTMREHKRERLKKLPVVVVTSYTSMKVYKKAAEFDINGFLRKPVAPGSLETAIVKALGGKVSAKAMQNYRAEANALHKEGGATKKPGFFAMLFGLEGSSSSQSSATNAARPNSPPGAAAAKPKPKINRSA